MTQQVDTRTRARARDEFARLLAPAGTYAQGAFDSVLGDRVHEATRAEIADPWFPAPAFKERAAVAQPLPPDMALPPQERPAPTLYREPAQDVVDLFLNGAAPDRPDT
ncbi:hypothetical protein ACGFI3_25845 [Nonomuraea wenchangensis]|uniref:hypothetical protein n=1 Tax=Nonomuraea wenchangensis TaxID=568860 RepID=UPI00371A9338